MADEKVQEHTVKTNQRVLAGTVVSAAMDKTIVVRVERKFKHPVVGKIVRTFKKYSAHDEAQTACVGDVVEIAECRPLSRTKHMMLKNVVKRKKEVAA